MTQLIVLDTPQSISDLKHYLKDKDLIAFDTETTGLSSTDEIVGYSVCAEENKAYYVVISKWNKETKKLDYTGTKEPSIDLIKSLKGKQLIMHNAVYDCMMVQAYFKVSLIESIHTDTVVLAHLLDENRRVGLKDLSVSMFGEDSAAEQSEMKQSVADNEGSLTKSLYEMYKADSSLLGKYGAKDALLTYKLFMELVPQLYEQGLDKFFYEEESMPLLKGPTYQLNTVGLKVDIKSLTSLKKTLQAECEEAKAYIYHEIDSYIKVKYPGDKKKNVFNIGSSSQLSWLIFGELGLEFSTLTKEGKVVCNYLIGKLPYKVSDKDKFIKECIAQAGTLYTEKKKIKEPWGYLACDKETLGKIAHKYKWIAKLLEYQQKIKILNTYVEGIEEKLRYGIIQPSFKQIGTSSGRYSSSNPNFQNLPRKDKRVKQCIVSRPGKVFVGADYSQLEPRVFAYMSQDKNLMTAFNGTDDFYSVIGMRVYGKTDCTPKKEGSPEAFGVKYPNLRDLSKVIALASTYGASASQLAKTTKKSKEDTQEDIDSYFHAFPGVAQMMLDSHAEAKSKGYVTSLYGRVRRIPEAKAIDRIYGKKAHADLPYEARGFLNLAVNHKIQGTAANIVNRAAIRFNEHIKQAGISANFVAQVHDSLIVECNETDAETVSLLLQDAMENTTILPGVPLEAIPKIGKNLAEV